MWMLTGLRGRHIPAHPFPKIPYMVVVGGVEGGSQEKKMVSELLPREKCLDLPGSSPQGS